MVVEMEEADEMVEMDEIDDIVELEEEMGWMRSPWLGGGFS